MWEVRGRVCRVGRLAGLRVWEVEGDGVFTARRCVGDGEGLHGVAVWGTGHGVCLGSMTFADI